MFSKLKIPLALLILSAPALATATNFGFADDSHTTVTNATGSTQTIRVISDGTDNKIWATVRDSSGVPTGQSFPIEEDEAFDFTVPAGHTLDISDGAVHGSGYGVDTNSTGGGGSWEVL